MSVGLQDLLDNATPGDAAVIAELPAPLVASVVEEAALQVDACRYGAKARQATILLALHILASMGVLESGGGSGQLASEENGPAKRSFATEQIAGYASEGVYASTPYGRRLLPLVRSARALSAMSLQRCGGGGAC